MGHMTRDAQQRLSTGIECWGVGALLTPVDIFLKSCQQQTFCHGSHIAVKSQVITFVINQIDQSSVPFRVSEPTCTRAAHGLYI